MISRLFINFDLSSFLLGVITGALIWLAAIISKKLIADIRKRASIRVETNHQDRTGVAANALLAHMLKAVQSEHLLSNYFQLDDLVIAPRFLSYPKSIFPSEMTARSNTFHDHLPFLPFCSEYGIQSLLPGISLLDCLGSYDRLVIIGNSGAGKSTAICHSVTQLLRDIKTNEDPTKSLLPIYLDYFDIFGMPGEDERVSLEDVLTQVITNKMSSASVKSTRSFLEKSLVSNPMVLFIDGLDELSTPAFDDAVRWMDKLIMVYPQLKIVTTASPTYFGELFQSGFSPLVLSSWNSHERSTYVKRTYQLIRSRLSENDNQKTLPLSVTDQLISTWIIENTINDRPIEITARVLESFTNSQVVAGRAETIATFLGTLWESNVSIDEASAFASQMILGNYPYYKVGERLSEQSSEKSLEPTNALPKHLDKFLASGILRENLSGWIKFSNPYFISTLSALVAKPAENAPTLNDDALKWCVAQDFAMLTSYKDQFRPWVDKAINDLSPDQSDLLQAIHWYRNVPNNDPGKSLILRRLLQQVQNQSLSFPVKAWMLMAGMADNKDAAAVIKRLLASEDVTSRTIGYLAISVCGDRQFIPILQTAVGHEQGSTHIAGWLALYALSPEDIHTLCLKNIQTGDEDLRMVTASILAGLDQRGYAILQENARSTDLLTRVASIYGMGFVHTIDSKAFLEKISVADEQWIIRKTAEVALSAVNGTPCLCPHVMSDIGNDEWLIHYASMLGLGINPNAAPNDTLGNALRSDVRDDFLNASLRFPHSTNFDMIEPLIEKLGASNDIDPFIIIYYLWLTRHIGSSTNN